MEARTPPTFGKRNLPPPPRAATADRALLPSDLAEDPHHAFFAAIRAEHGTAEVMAEATCPRREVPRSLRAGILAGLVVACGLAGLDATARLAAPGGLAAVLPDQPATTLLGPALILLAVVGGGRAAATSLLVAHWGLARLGQTGHAAYTAGGAVAAATFAALLLAALGQPPAHGFAIEVLAGAAGGFFYRVFAGSRPAEPARAP